MGVGEGDIVSVALCDEEAVELWDAEALAELLLVGPCEGVAVALLVCACDADPDSELDELEDALWLGVRVRVRPDETVDVGVSDGVRVPVGVTLELGVRLAEGVTPCERVREIDGLCVWLTVRVALCDGMNEEA